MYPEPFPRSALEANRAGRLTPEQVQRFHAQAGESRRTGVVAGLAILAAGLFILWGSFNGRIPGSRLQSFGVGAAFTAVGALLVGSRARTRNVRATESVSESTVLEMIEGPFRRERVDRQDALSGTMHATKGDARYLYYFHVGERRLCVAESEHEAAPDDGLVRVWLLPGSDRVANLERIGEAPPSEPEARAIAELRRRFGDAAEAMIAEERKKH